MKKLLLLWISIVVAPFSVLASTPREETVIANATEVSLRDAVSFTPAEVKSVNVKRNKQGAFVNMPAVEDAPVSSYNVPNGVFHWGLRADLSGMAMIFGTFDLIAPMHQALTWTNTTPQADSFSWSYRDANLQNATSTERDLVTPAFGAGSGNADRVIAPPTLTSTLGTATSKYQECNYVKYGGGAINGTLQYGACSYKRLKTLQVAVSPLMGNGCDDALTNHLVEAGTIANGDVAQVQAFGNYFEKPEHPYALYGMNVLAYTGGVVGDVAALTMKIYECSKNEDGSLNIGRLISTSSIGKDGISIDANTQLSDCKFSFATTDLMGEAAPLTISTGIYCELSGMGSLETFKIVFPGMPERYENHGYISADVTANGSTINQKIPTSSVTYTFTNQNTNAEQNMYCTDLMFHLWMFYSWMECADDELIVTDKGGRKDFTMSAYDKSDTWTICTTSGEDIPNWIVCETEDDVTTVGSNTNAYNGQTKLTITVAEMSESDSVSREAELYIGIPGAYHVITVKQEKSTGIASVMSQETVKVAADGDNFVISAPASASSVDIYNAAGQCLRSASVQGKAIISAQDLSRGLYILKFNNGASAKVVK